MAFSFASPGNALVGAGNLQTGSKLVDIQTEVLGFQAFAGESKVQLLPSPWPADSLPPPTASLLSIASRQGLIAAVGPDVVILARTESARRAFEGSGEGHIKTFEPELKIPMPMRVSQLTFSADESYLVLSAEIGGGLAVYEVASLLQGSTQSAFELSTQGLSLRALIPNPTPDKGELIAVVTTDGKLMMANLRGRDFVQAPNGPVLKANVSCVSWSTKGKQLVAGLGDGTAHQMTPEGVGKEDIPKPPALGQEYYLSSLTWLENNLFLLVHTSSVPGNGNPPVSKYHILTRQPPNFLFQELDEVASPFGLARYPPHHFIARLREFPPNLQDMLVVASSASADVGLFTRSKAPLTSSKPADAITGVFTMTEMSDDSRRAQLPYSLAGMGDTSPIGLALDLSSTNKVVRPIRGDEMNESPTPLPALMILNNDGILASWWIIYNDSLRNGTIYPSLVAAAGSAQSMQMSPAPAATAGPTFGAPSKPAFGAPSAFGSTSALSQGSSPWGSPSRGAPAFGSPSGLGAAGKTTPAFGAPAFGATSTPAFGSSGLPGNRSSHWASTKTASTTPAFGQSAGLGKPTSIFGSAAPTSGTPPSSGGFGKFASQGGFAAAAQNTSGSIFGSKPASNAFGAASVQSASNNTGAFGSFGGQSDQKEGSASSGFVLGSTFKADSTAQEPAQEPANETKSSFFGGDFGKSLASAEKAVPVTEEAAMDAAEEPAKPDTSEALSSTTLTTAPAPQRIQMLPTAPAAGGSVFGTPSTSTGSALQNNTAGFNFDKLKPTEEKADEASISGSQANILATPPNNNNRLPAISDTPASPKIKQEPDSDEESSKADKTLLEAPLPPEPTTRPRFGDSSNSSVGTDAPLPPDFAPKPTAAPTKPAPDDEKPSEPSRFAGDIPPLDVPGGPEEEEDDSGFLTEEEDEEDGKSQTDEGSGEDVAKDLSPTSETAPTPGFTPQSSSTGMPSLGTESSLFTKIEKPTNQPSQRSLFGEVGSSMPSLPPPKLQQSPRSPSPVRNAIPPRMLRPESSRSVSAPGVASQLLGSQKKSDRPAVLGQSTFAATVEERRAEEDRRAKVKAKKEEEESRSLLDEEDEKLQRFLSEDIVPSRTLDEFIAHADYVSDSSNTSISAQVETVYRDINSMIDALGLNAKALKSFVVAHDVGYKDSDRTTEDLEHDDDWCLVEAAGLGHIVGEILPQELEEGRVTDIDGKLEACRDLQTELTKLWSKYEEVNKILLSLKDPEQLEAARAQPLNTEEAAQQHTLRRGLTSFQKLLAEAEEVLTILKAKLVSYTGSMGNSSSGPTVEAVMRTIAKMTSMAEKRSGDIDVLEGQMRRLRFSSINSTRSSEGSPLATPQNKRSIMRDSSTSGGHSIFYTPESIKENGRSFRTSIVSTTSSPARNSPRKKLTGYSVEEKFEMRQKLARKAEATARLRSAMQKNAVQVRLMDDGE